MAPPNELARLKATTVMIGGAAFFRAWEYKTFFCGIPAALLAKI
jgi:hypothetical protein